MTRLLMAGRTRYRLPLTPALDRKFDALQVELDVHVLASAQRGNGASDARFRLVAPLPVLDGPLFYLRFPFLVARELRRLHPDAVLVQGAQETALALLGRKLARSSSKVILDLHGDPGSAVRLYGSRPRRLLAPVSDLLARRAIRGADADRTLSPFTTGLVRRLGVEPAGEFPAYGPGDLPRAARGAPARRAWPSSSSACSSATRPSRCWPRHGEPRRRGCPPRRSTSSGEER